MENEELQEVTPEYLGSFYREPAWKKRMRELSISDNTQGDDSLPVTSRNS